MGATGLPKKLKLKTSASLSSTSRLRFFRVCFESHTILRYLAQKYNAPDHWYPKDLYARTRVDQYLDWHHRNLRELAPFTFAKVWAPRLKISVSEENVKQYTAKAEKALKDLDTVWLSNRRYLGGDQISIADLSAICELSQLKSLKYDLSPYSNIVAWTKNIENMPEYISTHAVLSKVVAKL